MLLWPICDLELAAHLICCFLWGHEWSGLEIWGLTDSEQTEYFLRNGRSRINRRLHMGRTLTALHLAGNYLWVPDGVRSAQNVLPDCASRWRDPERRQTFWQECADLNVVPHERTVTMDMFNNLPLHMSR